MNAITSFARNVDISYETFLVHSIVLTLFSYVVSFSSTILTFFAIFVGKRKKIVNVTAEGAKIAQKIMDYDEKWDETIKKSLTESEYDDFKKLLKKICEDLI